MSTISLTNIIRVTVLSALRGLANANTSALALITDEAPIPGTYGTSRVYRNPAGVAQDFGSNSETYRVAVKVFSQNPNILTGGGYLAIIPRDQAAADSAATFVSEIIDLTQLTETDYYINLNIDGVGAGDLLIGELDLTDIGTVEASLNSTAVSAAGATFHVSGELTGARITLVSDTAGAASSLVIGSTATGTDINDVFGFSGTVTGTATGLESVKDCILRTYATVEYFGIIYNTKEADAVVSSVGALIQSLDKMQFVGSNLSADIAGIFTTVKNAGLTNTRCLYYSESESDAIDFAAGYASRGLSINFDAANTAITMHLKEIIGLVADSGLTQTLIDQAQLAGVDVYADFGVPKVFTSGANTYFDEVYILLAFKLRLTVAGFNFLATTGTKIPQTEAGMNQLKAAYREVCSLFVANGSFAPGVWTGSTTFGNPEDHIRNIADFGFYIYSLPISLQSATERSSRVAPVIQIAAKGAGAIHSSDVIVQYEG